MTDKKKSKMTKIPQRATEKRPYYERENSKSMSPARKQQPQSAAYNQQNALAKSQVPTTMNQQPLESVEVAIPSSSSIIDASIRSNGD